MRSFAYSAPASLDEALALLRPGTRPLAGGTDLLTLMKADLVAPDRLVAIRALLPRGIHMEEDAVAIGAGATLHEIESHPALRRTHAALAQAAGAAASPQLRNMATLGGNLLQRPRCWYFRHPQVRCWLKGGTHCAARDGENRNHAILDLSPCMAVHPSDPAAALIAFEAEVRVRAAQGEGTMAMDQFFAVPEEGRRSETRLPEDALILSVRVPAPPQETRSIYLKAMDRQAFAFALAGVAAVVRVSGGRVQHARVVLSGVAPVPWRAQAAEQALVGSPLNESTIEEAARAALEEARPLAQNGYKLPLARALVRRALAALGT